MKARYKEFFSIIFLYIVCAFFFLGANSFKGDAGLFPKILSGLIFILNSINLFFAITKDVPEKRKMESRSNKKLLIIGLLSIAYILSIKILGFVVSSILFLIASFMLLEVKNKLVGVIIAVITIVAIYISFSVFLKVKIPTGIFGI